VSKDLDFLFLVGLHRGSFYCQTSCRCGAPLLCGTARRCSLLCL